MQTCEAVRVLKTPDQVVLSLAASTLSAGPRLVVLCRAVKASVTALNDGVLATRQAACLNRPNGTLIYGKEKRARTVTAQSRSVTGAFPSIVHALPSDFYLVPTALVLS